MAEKKLNLGCGASALNGYINLDKYKYPGVDITWDLEKIPLPFKNEEFNEIKAENILEHLDYKILLVELSRILRENGRLLVRVPHYTSRDVYADPTHRYGFSVKTFSFFVKSSRVQNKEYNFRKYRKLKVHIEFEKRIGMFWNYLIEIMQPML